MKIEYDLSKTLHQNAGMYFEKSKKSKEKLKGLENAIKKMEERIAKTEEKKEKKAEKKRHKEWFEKFHWSITCSGFLVIGGRDRQSNEALVKKHLEENDLYFHADIAGASHVVLKTEGRKPEREDEIEAAEFAGIHSKAWSQKLALVDVYSVKPEQVSKKAPSGESLSSGAFMVYGKRKWFKSELKFWIGIDEKERVFAGSEKAVKKYCKKGIEVIQGNLKKSDLAKLLQKKGLKAELDDLIRSLPSDGLKANTKL